MINKEIAKENLKKLIEKFEKEFSSGRIQEYNEEATKTAFVQPLLKDVLGWNVNDNNEVSPEYKVSKKRVDYGIKINGKVKMFIEVKPVKAELGKHIEQAVKYGYNRRDVPFVILTDFEGIKLFDVTVKPDLKNFNKGLKLDLDWKEYIDKFDVLWQLSKESALSGDIDKLLFKKGKEKLPVDKAILESLEEWRLQLAKNIYKHNHKLFSSDNIENNAEYLKSITQKLIDRIIFIRFCEDRGLVVSSTLKNIFEERTGAVGAKAMLFLKPKFKEYLRTFNSDLFAIQEWEENLAIDFEVMQEVILDTYNPYQFDVIPLEVLGNIYEQYLGDTIRLTEHQVKYEQKPEVRKAGGVYYTPEYIVDYIVKNTVGKLLKELPPAKAKKLRILDPACGSGSFLIRAYEEMINYYRVLKKEQKEKKIDLEPIQKFDLHLEEEKYRLTIQEKSEILKNHIFGVDIDEQAVEVTKLSLMLKMLEDESAFIPGIAVLPMLNHNINCGNSLISGDTLELKKYFGNDYYKVKELNWRERFKSVMDEGGFNVVIGNPPYFNISILDKNMFHYIESKYPEIHTGYNDIMYYFIYNGIKLLNKDGVYGVITSNYYLGNSYAKPIRRYLRNYLQKIINFKDYLIFKEANIHTNIIIASKNPKANSISYFEKLNKDVIDVLNIENGLSNINLLRSKLSEDWIIAGDDNLNLINRLQKSGLFLNDFCIIEKGSTSGKNEVFTVSKEFAYQNKLENSLLKKNVKSGDIDRYILKDRGDYLIYIDSHTEIQTYPKIFKYLSTHKNELSERNEVKKNLYAWYRIERPRKKEIFESSEKLIVPYRADKNKFAYDNERRFNDGGDIRAIVLKQDVHVNIKFILAILNSKLMNWYYGFIGKPKGKMREYFNEPLSKIPIVKIDLKIENEKKIHDSIVSLVEVMVNLNLKAHKASGNEKERIQQQITQTDHEIDDLVYKLYDITDEERKIIEGNTI